MRGEHISFLCSFCRICVLRDYYYDGRLHTDFEEERLREKKGKMFSPLHHLRPTTEREREKKYCVRNKNETVFKFLLCRNF